jgi:SAM-dependent methyltransferase
LDKGLTLDNGPLHKEWPLKGKDWHRRFVGARNQKGWLLMGNAQLNVLKKYGMRHQHKLLDVGCGSFRLGHIAINYLDKGNYCGIDIQEDVIREGIKNELKGEWKEKCPRFFVSDNLTIPNGPFDFAIAQSVFTHMSSNQIKTCVKNVLKELGVGGMFLASYNWGKKINDKIKYPDMSSFPTWHLKKLVESAGGYMNHIGDWGITQNKRNQQLLVIITRQV